MIRIRGHRGVLVALLVALSGCGGGGGDEDSGGGGSSGHGFSVSNSNLSIRLPVTTRDAATTTVVVTPLTDETRNAAVRARYSTNGIADVTFVRVGDTLELTLTYKEPYRTAPDTYTDTINIEACTNDSCDDVIAGTLSTIASNYVIFMPTGADAPRMTVSTTNIDLQALITQSRPPETPNVDVTYANVPVLPTVQMTVDRHALYDAYYLASDAEAASIRLSVMEPNYLASGNYVDRVTLRACLDSDCVNPLPESPITITLNLDVSNSVDGPNGYTVNVLNITPNDLVWDRHHSRLYVSTPVLSDGQGPGVIVLDPATRNIEQSIPLPSIPHVLALSDDGAFLYVGYLFRNKVSRLILPAMTMDLEIPLGTTIGGSPMMPHDMQVKPGAPHTVAIARTFDQQSANYSACGLIIFDDTTARPNTTPSSCDDFHDPIIDYIQWHGSGIYASDAYTSPGKMFDIAIDSNGVQSITTTDNVISRRLHYDGGVLYNDLGDILDPVALTVMGSFPVHLAAQAHAAASDAQANRYYLLNTYQQRDADDNTLSYPNVAVYDEQQRTRLTEIPMDERWTIRRIVRWGTDGLALNSVALGYEDGRLILINGPGIVPP